MTDKRIPTKSTPLSGLSSSLETPRPQAGALSSPPPGMMLNYSRTCSAEPEFVPIHTDAIDRLLADEVERFRERAVARVFPYVTRVHDGVLARRAQAFISERTPCMFRPLNDRVLIEPIAPEEFSRGGIVIPASNREKQIRGTVLAVGPGKILRDGGKAACTVKVGDTVVFNRYAGTELLVEDKKCRVICEDDVLGIEEQEAKAAE